MEKICVAVRVRPAANKEETANGNGTFWKVEDNRISLHRCLGTPISGVSYAFDHVFNQDCSNYKVYDLLTKDIIYAAVDGFNGTAFAYGQTSSGKTYTMNGSESDPGIIHRAVKDIFTKIQLTTDREFLIRVSYMEIYNEEINDLLSVESQRLQIHESLERGVFVAGLREEIVNNAEQVLQLIQVGEDNRHFGETNMNVHSSRSHTIFRMVIESKRKIAGSNDTQSSDDTVRVSVLNLVDLAGSERIAKTGAGGVRLKEGKHINKSLMILGNVINKLSEGGKQRAHIPYRDSKLTRILQPALGGNAKTSIICTVAPEEVHVEETKGTLQFASRAKRITNCVQVNEIITDAALLKRQRLEIEALQKKLQGSRAEVLEQEILKLRNDMLKYELDREKLSLELEEERRLQIERDRCIREQQMKIAGLSSLVTTSDSERSTTEENVHVSRKEERSDSGSLFREDAFSTPCFKENVHVSRKEERSDSGSLFREDAFSTPCFKAVPNAFVVRRSNYSKLPECSPLPDAFDDFADEDTWTKMNKGYVADLDSLLMTPAGKAQSFPVTDVISQGSTKEDYKQEILSLQRQLSLVTEERDKLKVISEGSTKDDYKQEILNLQQQLSRVTEERDKLKERIQDDYKHEILNLQQQLVLVTEEGDKLKINHMQQEAMNTQLVGQISELHKEAFAMQEIPQRLSESVGICKDVYNDVLLKLQTFVADENSATAKLLSTTREIGSSLLSTLESHFSMSVDSNKISSGDNASLCQRLNGIISSLVLCDAPELIGEQLEKTQQHYQVHNLGREIASWKKKVDQDLEAVRQKYTTLEEEMNKTRQQLKASKSDFRSLEREFKVLKEERDALLQQVSSKSQRLALVTDQKEKAMKNLKTEIQKRRDLEQEITKFSKAFACRQKSLMSLNTDFQALFGGFKAQNSVPISKSLGC